MAFVTKHFHRLLRNIASFSDGQAHVLEDSYDLDELASFRVVLAPNDGPYRGGTFEFEVGCHWYPHSPPKVTCLSTPIFHPNIISGSGDVCLNLFEDDWTSELTFEEIVQGLLFLMYNPNMNDPLDVIFDWKALSEAEFRRVVRKTLRGGTLGDIDFPRNLGPAYEDDELDKDD